MPLAEKRKFRNHLGIYRLTRPIRAIRAGYTLRIIDAEHFKVVYSTDNWTTVNSLISTTVGAPGSFADIPTTPGETSNIVFTLCWPTDGAGNEERWLGRNIEIPVIPA